MFAALSKEKKITIKKIILNTGLDKKSKELILLICYVYPSIYMLAHLSHAQIYLLIKKIDCIRRVERYNSLIRIIDILAICDNSNQIKLNIQALQNIIKQVANINYSKLAKKYPTQMNIEVKNSILQIINNTFKNTNQL